MLLLANVNQHTVKVASSCLSSCCASWLLKQLLCKLAAVSVLEGQVRTDLVGPRGDWASVLESIGMKDGSSLGSSKP